jgi:hypothetical protein
VHVERGDLRAGTTTVQLDVAEQPPCAAP